MNDFDLADAISTIIISSKSPLYESRQRLRTDSSFLAIIHIDIDIIETPY